MTERCSGPGLRGGVTGIETACLKARADVFQAQLSAKT